MMKRELTRFVVLKHSRQNEKPHYDLMLETDNAALLATFSFELSPDEFTDKRISEFKQIEDHDRKFLQYEGSVNGGTGTVEQVDKGKIRIISLSPLKCHIYGKTLRGIIVCKYRRGELAYLL